LSATGLLFDPFTLNKLKLRNRIVMAPMTRCFSPGGVPGPGMAGYYARRAAAGVGLIVTEGTVIDHPAALGDSGVDGLDVPNLHDPAALDAWREVVAQVHAAGGLIFPQLWHQGSMRRPGSGPHPEAPSCRPSGLWGPLDRLSMVSDRFKQETGAATRPMTEEEIADVIAAYARSARNAMAVGFDGIAIHGAHGYLPDVFLWAETNQRTDRWGGSIARRATFVAEFVKAIRRKIGPDTPILLRFSQWKQQDVKAKLAHTPAELEAMLGPIADAGVDMFDGSQRFVERPEFEGSDMNLAGWAKKVTGKPSMTVGTIGTRPGEVLGGVVAKDAERSVIPHVAAQLERGDYDLVGVGRALLQDPEWIVKLRDGVPFEPFEESSRDRLT
jgi:2,4-dienoyl-CoA reductase-like NADH-dependent reductase (Old Yellow Enzyme family)